MSSKEHKKSNDKTSSKGPIVNPTNAKLEILAPETDQPEILVKRARIDSSSLNPQQVLQLQRTIGNKAIQRLLGSKAEENKPCRVNKISTGNKRVFGRTPVNTSASVQLKRDIGGVGDQFEKEGFSEKKGKDEQGCCPDDDEQAVQGKFVSSDTAAQLQGEESKSQKNTGLPNPLKAGLEHLSSFDLSDVRVHSNSPKPAQINALAYTQGNDIHVGPGQEKHLPHEGWHVVQQMQGRVQPTIQAKGMSINDDAGLEREAEVMGSRAFRISQLPISQEGVSNGDVRRASSGAYWPSQSTLIQLATCQEEFGAPGTTPEPNALSVQKGAAKTRLRTNLNSWDAYLIDRLRAIASGLFSTEEEIAWWGNWATGLVVDLIGDAIPGPIGTAIKAIAAAGERIAGQTIANARARLGQAAVDSVIAYRTSERARGETYIDNYYERLRSRTTGDCAGYHDLLLQSIDRWWPELDTAALPQARALAQELMERVRAAELVDQMRREYETCLGLVLERSGGLPTEDEERRAREDCRRRTGYSPITAC